MKHLNYHHLRYFREVALEGNLSRAAEQLNISQSALSIQIKSLEDRLETPLFERIGRKLLLTEAGHIALEYADRIFNTGDELVATLDRDTSILPPLRIGALSTLSRNFQMAFLRPAMKNEQSEIFLKSGNISTLLDELKSLNLDVILTTEVPQSDYGSLFAAQRIADQTVGIHGLPHFLNHTSLRELLAHEPLILPTDSVIRSGFESLIHKFDIKPHIVANVDDMAMVRLLARDGAGLAIAPAVVLADEIANNKIQTAPFDLNITEAFYAVTLQRKYPHPLLKTLLNAQFIE